VIAADELVELAAQAAGQPGGRACLQAPCGGDRAALCVAHTQPGKTNLPVRQQGAGLQAQRRAVGAQQRGRQLASRDLAGARHALGGLRCTGAAQ
jgi:hypothetical protein